MVELEQTEDFQRWKDSIKDKTVKVRILARLARVETGNFGDHAPVGAGVYEIRLQFDPGYRIYYKFKATTVVLLFCGGDKSTQNGDIEKAKILAREH
ncbi:MAG: type II toxin-antitoxin system RelE/ParE family toxin [Acidobacteriota bacterium]|jgi:putative addiction module killer protein|nr:type II toxin-antitoxin system RelE/ParE family toxin [Acidobacteriota bacterium]